ncbi:hypothetical protein GCM10009798_38050 [Nocardioides panacihumi]|uniref:DUF998 domain-containing protein n=1 Tax=Nocardioides panacihumi TaxID=400774 RepID=A0ABP5D322_9ACTN
MTTAVGTCSLVLVVAVLPSADAVLPLVGRIAELALAGSAAYLIDDAAVALTAVAPRGTWRRRAPTLAAGAALLGVGWVAVLLMATSRDLLRPPTAVSGELVVLATVAVAAAATLARRGDPEPGVRVAPGLVLLGVSLLILESVLRRPLLVPWNGPARAGLLLAWAGVGLLALVIALWASRDPVGRSRPMRPPCRRR